MLGAVVSEHRERTTRSERAGDAARKSACRGVRRGEAPRIEEVQNFNVAFGLDETLGLN
jgi:hypothetical protein